MNCYECGRPMRKVDRRNEMAELNVDATDGQMADYLAAELYGDNGAWNIGIVAYSCNHCELELQIVNDRLTSFYPLIYAWHKKAAYGDTFSRFVFQYLAFIAHIRNNIFYEEQSDRMAIQKLKQDNRLKSNYIALIYADNELRHAWDKVIAELDKQPLRNSSTDPDHPEIEKWWNSNGNTPSSKDALPRGVVRSVDDWMNMVEFWYGVRNNLFHGGKDPNLRRDIFLVEYAFLTLRPFMEAQLQRNATP